MTTNFEEEEAEVLVEVNTLLTHPIILGMTLSERFELYKQGYKALHNTECSTAKSLTYITFYDNCNKKKRAAGNKRAAAAVDGGHGDNKRAAAAVDGGHGPAELADAAAVAGGGTVDGGMVTPEKPKTTHKKTPLKPAKAAAPPDLFSLFRVAKHWKELPLDYLHQLLNQDTCCCGCNDGVFKKLDESHLDRFLGFHFCTKTKLRLAADWCKYRYGESAFVEADSHPCKTCGTPAHLTLQVQNKTYMYIKINDKI